MSAHISAWKHMFRRQIQTRISPKVARHSPQRVFGLWQRKRYVRYLPSRTSIKKRYQQRANHMNTTGTLCKCWPTLLTSLSTLAPLEISVVLAEVLRLRNQMAYKYMYIRFYLEKVINLLHEIYLRRVRETYDIKNCLSIYVSNSKLH